MGYKGDTRQFVSYQDPYECVVLSPCNVSFVVEELLIVIVNKTAAKVVPEVLGVPQDIIFNIVNMGCKHSKLSAVGKVKEAIMQSTGDLRTLHTNLAKLQADHIVFEREQVQSQLEANIAARQLLAEAALKVGITNDCCHLKARAFITLMVDAQAANIRVENLRSKVD
ncbi:uncharacterized protein BJ212DRAFT_1304628 [Suillus subaureus]|uniref:Uncharacterized protein n=1 Tax=Suillus subaureus TaxID=48587 RepID=A0A9P7J524_9AGAM|nr:uncharacterized protein BJ212DRAFT_1304628 [Suillus subaureus]KAG1803226.1 hypothetical protein BJ212DRAFT_1304628 [Suillus subaureus]